MKVNILKAYIYLGEPCIDARWAVFIEKDPPVISTQNHCLNRVPMTKKNPANLDYLPRSTGLDAIQLSVQSRLTKRMSASGANPGIGSAFK